MDELKRIRRAIDELDQVNRASLDPILARVLERERLIQAVLQDHDRLEAARSAIGRMSSPVASAFEQISEGSGVLAAEAEERLLREQIGYATRLQDNKLERLQSAFIAMSPPDPIRDFIETMSLGLPLGEATFSDDDEFEEWDDFEDEPELESALRERIARVEYVPVRLEGDIRRHIWEMAWDRFEHFVADLFEGDGFTVQMTQRSRDRGRDIIATRTMESGIHVVMAVECKAWRKKKVGDPVLRTLLGSIHDRRNNHRHAIGVLATTSTFTSPARDFLIHNPNIEGRDLDALVKWLKRVRSR